MVIENAWKADKDFKTDVVAPIKKGDKIKVTFEVKAKDGNTKASKTVLENPNYKVDNLLKLTSQNINQSNNIFTVPYYLSFYILNK